MTENIQTNSEQKIRPEIIVNNQPTYNDSMQEILALIRGRVPVIWVLTHEEGRFIEDFNNF